ncbi:hypothetical protein FACS1894174_07390 [Bacteroidia bacterium]|nr:hypothetical protein FACS1894203_4090 [Bacteroidia bacterium]GHV22581.1 hypothetical protein FACS1894174_07390 [Bacteroidia bacterium]
MLGEGTYEKGKEIAQKNNWTKPGQEGALNYKMQFVVDEIPVISYNNEVQKDRQGNVMTVVRKDGRNIKKLKPYPLYFANLNADIDNSSEYKCFSMLSKPFTMRIQSLHSDLLEYIKKTVGLGVFFQYTNFGTRQSKGFGSFYIDEKDDLYKDIEDLKYRFSVDIRNENKKWLDLFNTIDLFYKSLRSGINICWGDKFRMNSAIYQYAKENNYDWDKTLIKDYFFRGIEPKQGNKFLFKDLLGLSSDESWMSYRTSITKEHSGKNDDKKIKRFQSPIIIKPILRGEYFDVFVDSMKNAKELFSQYCNEEFNIEAKNTKKKPLPLTLPEFNIDDFLKFALLENDIGNLTDNRNHEIFLKLRDIYNEIKREHEEE